MNACTLAAKLSEAHRLAVRATAEKGRAIPGSLTWDRADAKYQRATDAFDRLIHELRRLENEE